MGQWQRIQILALFFLICLIGVLCFYTLSFNSFQLNKFPTEWSFQAERSLQNESQRKTNSNFTDWGDLDIFGISLPKRKESHFKVLEKKLNEQNLVINYFEALNGKDLDINDYNVAPHYQKFFEQNDQDRKIGTTKINYWGHLGALVSHLSVVETMNKMTLVFEDDACIVPNFRIRLKQLISDVTELDENWEVLILGYSAKYSDHFYHKDNDHEPLYKGYIVKLHYWIGLWGYVCRNQQVAEKLLSFFNIVNWHVDLTLAEQARLGNLSAYGVCRDTLANHPGTLRISSWDYYQNGDVSLIRSDTNN